MKFQSVGFDSDKLKAIAPGVANLINAVKEQPEIKEWIEKRPKTDY